MKNKQAFLLGLIANLGVAMFTAVVVFIGNAIALSLEPAFWKPVAGGLIPTSLCIALFWSRKWVVSGAALAIAALLLSIPMFTSVGRDPIRAEAEQMLGSVKGRVRVVYAKYGDASNIRTLTGPREAGSCEVLPSELQGMRYRIRDQVILTETGAILYADPMPGEMDRSICTITFNWSGGDGRFAWDP